MKAHSRILNAAIFAVLLALPDRTSAQAPPGIDEFHQVTRDVSSWYFSLSDLVFVIGAISGILGGLRVYANWQIGGHHHRHPIDSQVIGWFLSCLFLILAGVFIKALYGI